MLLLCAAPLQRLHHLSLAQVPCHPDQWNDPPFNWQLVLANLRELRSLQLCKVGGVDRWIKLLRKPYGGGRSNGAASFLCPRLQELSFCLLDPAQSWYSAFELSSNVQQRIPSTTALASLAHVRPSLSLRVNLSSLADFEAGVGRSGCSHLAVQDWRDTYNAYNKLLADGRITLELRLPELM
jgi:hypothetical protein